MTTASDNTPRGIQALYEAQRRTFKPRIDTVPELHAYLQAALEVELSTVPVYLAGMYSIKPGTNQEAFYTIRSVVMEEMLHATLVANLMNAVGAVPKVAEYGHVPQYPMPLPFHRDQTFKVGLQNFSKAALRTFIQIEAPDQGLRPDSTGWTSIGQFYAIVREGMENVLKTQGGDESKLFKQDQKSLSKQIGPEDFYNSGGEVIKVTDMRSARQAMEIIIEEGEGSHESIMTGDDRMFGEEPQVAHYFRFLEIYHERRFDRYDAPSDPPTGSPLHVDWESAYQVAEKLNLDEKAGKKVPVPTLKHSDFKESPAYEAIGRFNTTYMALLAQLHKAFNGNPALLKKAIPTMLEMRYLAEEIYRNPKKPGSSLCASPTFEVTDKGLKQALKEIRDT